MACRNVVLSRRANHRAGSSCPRRGFWTQGRYSLQRFVPRQPTGFRRHPVLRTTPPARPELDGLRTVHADLRFAAYGESSFRFIDGFAIHGIARRNRSGDHVSPGRPDPPAEARVPVARVAAEVARGKGGRCVLLQPQAGILAGPGKLHRQGASEELRKANRRNEAGTCGLSLVSISRPKVPIYSGPTRP